jgi:hypothetical protein
MEDGGESVTAGGTRDHTYRFLWHQGYVPSPRKGSSAPSPPMPAAAAPQPRILGNPFGFLARKVFGASAAADEGRREGADAGAAETRADGSLDDRVERFIHRRKARLMRLAIVAWRLQVSRGFAIVLLFSFHHSAVASSVSHLLAPLSLIDTCPLHAH